LRRFEPGDVVAFERYRSDPAVARFQGWDAPVSRADAEGLVREFAAGDPARPGWFQYAVDLTATGSVIGDVGVHLHVDRVQAAIGYTLAGPYQGYGYATEAVSWVLDDLFGRGVRCVLAGCDPRNHRSIRLLKRIGFRLEAYRPEHSWVTGEWTGDLVFELSADRWNPSSSSSSSRRSSS